MEFKNCSVENQSSNSVTTERMNGVPKWYFLWNTPEKKKHFMERLHDFLCEDLYAALPELKPLSSPRVDKGPAEALVQFCFL